jgi:large subunit ribosomal protein L18
MSVPYRRKREGKTNYKTRLKLLLSSRPRLVVRKSNKNLWCQLVEYSPDGDKVIASSHSRELAKYGLKTSRCNLPVAYLTGILLGRRAVQKKHSEALLDIGLYTSTKGSRLYAALKGAVDAGMKIPYSEGILPAQERLEGKHISGYKPGAPHSTAYKDIDILQYFKKIKEQILK